MTPADYPSLQENLTEVIYDWLRKQGYSHNIAGLAGSSGAHMTLLTVNNCVQLLSAEIKLKVKE